MDTLEQLGGVPLQQFFDTIFDLTKEKGDHTEGNGIWDGYFLAHGSARIAATKVVMRNDRSINVLFSEDGVEHSLSMVSLANGRLTMSLV